MSGTYFVHFLNFDTCPLPSGNVTLSFSMFARPEAGFNAPIPTDHTPYANDTVVQCSITGPGPAPRAFVDYSQSDWIPCSPGEDVSGLKIRFNGGIANPQGAQGTNPFWMLLLELDRGPQKPNNALFGVEQIYFSEFDERGVYTGPKDFATPALPF